MSIPDYQTLMLPALRTLSDGLERSPREVISTLANEYALTDQERKQMLPSGRVQVLNNRVSWAVTYLLHAGLVAKPRRGIWQITEEGARLLTENPPRIDNRFLARYPAFVQWRGKSPPTSVAGVQEDPVEVALEARETPEEILERTLRAIQRQVAGELLDQIMAASSQFFERLVVQLLVAMGYGGSYAEAAKVTRATGDGGIDGIINEDRLGLDVIYLQAKRWEANVGRPEIQKFAGSLEGERARKGVFITTSSFSPDAREYVNRIDKRIILIDGTRLADLMIEHGVGVTTDRQYAIPKLDIDFFDE
jgi:restriction system protein